MIIQSKRIGTVEVKDDRIIFFKDGIVGFKHLTRFFLADDPDDAEMPFKWLVSIDKPELMFLVTDPGIFFKDYVFDIEEADQKIIDAKTASDVSVITILTVPADPKQITANLRGPLVINWKTMVGRQIILKNIEYQTKHYIFIQKTEAEASSSTKAPEVNAAIVADQRFRPAPMTSLTGTR